MGFGNAEGNEDRQMIRLGFLLLGIGSSLFLWREIWQALQLVFPTLELWMFAQLLGLLFVEQFKLLLDERFSHLPQCMAHMVRVTFCLMGLLFVGLGLVGGLLYSFLQNQKTKSPIKKSPS